MQRWRQRLRTSAALGGQQRYGKRTLARLTMACPHVLSAWAGSLKQSDRARSVARS